MTLLSLLVALLLEQVRPIRQANWIQSWVVGKLEEVRGLVDPNGPRSIWAAWLLVVAGSAIFGLVVGRVLGFVHPLLELIFAVGVLYLTLGFRQFSHRFHDIQAALRADDLPEARRLLSLWTIDMHADPVARAAAESGDESAVVRESIRLALVSAQRHVFGLIFWFVVLPGVSGALAYWLSVQMLRAWGEDTTDLFGQTARAAYRWVDWLPVRVTAMIFAVVGNFEDSVAMWRARAVGSPMLSDDTDRVLIASGAGAIGVRLTIPDAPTGSDDYESYAEGVSAEPELREASIYSMNSAVGLVWRAVIIWFFLVLLFYLGRWLS
ncbi:MAG: regulatory signaling modulator protein AmpE [Burkholderiaceae bacterium]